ncbi:MAG: DNA mismatch repair protein MutS [Candidatus Dadabacteria bacterium]|nr:DNA mismatch repair protein MutS [Candidatus Dadabacteria bacterium]MYA47881.1 DNA mismatch repair protein MutS [Candidatus Dadabacteria bacterium]MYF47791.1 DNA mismatch repair protein MutS [Candidatus Dadabacteria bacterium]MYG82790.1 DNA mismatch repair protein MutS [Candidatus Dadabacteria bacterium]MYK49022.1 DNA mismatch repair protein MutS [Candidatus Dadabacteria bacterium]
MSSQTPLMNQYLRVKREYPDAILLFRLGDFYEMFYDDAKTASEILGIALTSRDRSKKNPVPLCGVPFHSAESHISKLLASGKKVAVCEQMGDPKQARGIVDRKVVRVLTPGVVLDSENLEGKSNNFLACVAEEERSFGLSFCDISTGEFRTSFFHSREDLLSELAHVDPKEILVPDQDTDSPWLKSLLDSTPRALVTGVDSWKWELERCAETLKDGFAVLTLEATEIEKRPGCVLACGVLFDYLRETQRDFLPQIEFPRYYDTVDYMKIDEWTARNLEIRSSTDGSVKHSLLGVMDETRSPMGARLLRRFMSYPLLDVEEIRKRQEAAAELLENLSAREDLTEALRHVGDLERLIHRIETPSARPRDLASLRDSSFYMEKLRDAMWDLRSEALVSLRDRMDDFRDLRSYLEGALVETPPVFAREGGIIKEGFSPELDRLRKIQSDGRKWISELEGRERERTGIANLKIGYNRVFGYYIEVTNSKLSLVPEDYSRRQTLAGSERFISPELKEYEEQILTAAERIAELEASLFEGVRARAAAEAKRIKAAAAVVAETDVFCSMGEIASRYGYCRPEFVSNPTVELRDSRHPVVERISLEKGFVPNDITLDSEGDRFMIITGPNMSGKSTLIRQVALISLMAQMGSFVPARAARLGAVDRIFSRVGASDNLTAGRSTFMVEMVETAHILQNATPRSLVILDEIGRGTSTFDGMSIAWAVSEYLYDLGPLTLFATHYHELSNLADVKPGIANSNVSVKEEGGEILFLRKLLPGATSHSYGIQVARLAGVPPKVLASARKVLFSLEKLKASLSQSMLGGQLLLFDEEAGKESEAAYRKEELLAEDLATLDPMNMTPMEALEKLVELSEKAKK